MSLASDPLDEAFPDAPAPEAELTGDPLDAAFPDKKAKKSSDDELYDPEGEAARALASGSEVVANAATRGAGTMLGGLRYATGVDKDPESVGRVADAFAYEPRTEAAKTIIKGVNTGASYLGQKEGEAAGNYVLDKTGSPMLASAANTAANIPQFLIPELAGKVGGKVAARYSPEGTVVERAQSAADASVASKAQGAAPVPINVAELTPETQAELADMHRKGTPVDNEALKRIHDAETLPKGEEGGVVRLTEAEAKGDVFAKAQENNAKGETPEIGARKAANDKAMHGSLDEMRRETSPGTVANSPEQNSQVLIDKLKGIGDTRDEAITNAYNDAKSLNGGKVSMQGGDYVARANAALDEGNAGDFLPADVRKAVVDKFAKNGGQMTLDDFLSARKTLGNAQRELEQSGQGNALHAVNVVRDQLEATKPATGLGADSKAAFDKASALAKSNFDDIKANPAYKAAYNDRSITPTGEVSDLNKNFAQKHVLGGTQANLQRLRKMFGGDEEANQTMTGIALNRLKEVSGNGEGEFRAKAYNDAYRKEIQPRARELLGADTKLQDNVEKLGRVSANIKAKDVSDISNHSNTNIAQRAVQAGVGLGRKGLNAVPYGKQVNEGIDYLAKGRDVNKILKPGAGLAQ